MLKKQRGPWKIDAEFTGEALHVRPRGDVAWHPLDSSCHCLPAADTCQLHDADGNPVHLPIYFHAALDGRDVPPPPTPGCLL